MELKELYDNITGERLYLNHEERERFLNATKFQDNDIKYFCQILFYTGCRLNEALGVLYSRIDMEEQGIIIEKATGSKPSMPPAKHVPETEKNQFSEWLECGAPGKNDTFTVKPTE